MPSGSPAASSCSGQKEETLSTVCRRLTLSCWAPGTRGKNRKRQPLWPPPSLPLGTLSCPRPEERSSLKAPRSQGEPVPPRPRAGGGFLSPQEPGTWRSSCGGCRRRGRARCAWTVPCPSSSCHAATWSALSVPPACSCAPSAEPPSAAVCAPSCPRPGWGLVLLSTMPWQPPQLCPPALTDACWLLSALIFFSGQGKPALEAFGETEWAGLGLHKRDTSLALNRGQGTVGTPARWGRLHGTVVGQVGCRVGSLPLSACPGLCSGPAEDGRAGVHPAPTNPDSLTTVQGGEGSPCLAWGMPLLYLFGCF
ncbi:baculoviral IAP repeat-containing protein 7 isoform X3 [Macaca mulatta]